MNPKILVTVALATTLHGAARRLPIEFEPNHGQAERGVVFLAHTEAHVISLTSRGMTVAAHDGPSVSMRFGNNNPSLTGEDQRAGVSNYLNGTDPSAWRRNVPHYGRVRYANVYPGIDAVFHGEEGSLEYDFIVAPGADPAAVRLTFDRHVRINPAGELVVRSANGEMRQHPPVLYQERDGVRVPIKGAYRLLTENQAGFTVEKWDHTRPLVIDPVLVYSSYIGLSGRAQLTALAVDSDGNTYLAGSVTSPDLPVSSGGFQGARKGFGTFRSSDKGANWGTANAALGSLRVEVFAVDPRNSAVIYAGTANGLYKSVNSGADWTLAPSTLPANDFTAVAIDPSNSSVVYAAGIGLFKSDDAGASWTRINLQVGILSIAISKQNPNLMYLGHQSFGLLRSRDGGVSLDFLIGNLRCNAVALDPADSNIIYAAMKDQGFYKSTDGGSHFTIYAAGLVANTIDPVNANVVTLDPKTTSRVYVGTSLGFFRSTNGGVSFTGSASLTGRRVLTIAVDPGDSNLIYAGTGSGVYKSTDAGVTFAAVGPVGVDVNALAIDPKSQYVYAGLYSGPDAFISKVAADGQTLLYSTYFGGSGADSASGIVVDPTGSVAFCGTTDSSDLPTRNPLQAKLGGGTDIYVARLNSAGSDIVFSTYLGSTGNDTCSAILRDPAGALYVVGNTYQPFASAGSNTYPTTAQAFQKKNPGGSTDCVVSKMDAGGKALIYSTFLGGNNADGCYAAAVDASGSVYLTGSTRSGDFPNTGANFGATQPSSSRLAYDTPFVTRLNSTGSALVFSGYLAGSDSIGQGHSISLGPTGRVYTAGLNLASNFPITDGALRTDNGAGVFLTAMEPDGSALVYSAIIPTLSDTVALQIDSAGNAWLASDASSVGTFPATPDAFDDRSRTGVIAATITEIDSAGANILYGTYLAGTAATSHSIAAQLSPSGALYVAGYALSTDFLPVTQSFLSAKTADYALFVQQIDTTTPAPPSMPVITAATFVDASIVIQGSHLGGNPVVAINGVTASITSFKAQQIVAQIPPETPPGDAVLTVTSNGLTSDPVTVTIAFGQAPSTRK